jgi:hypothetical protein
LLLALMTLLLTLLLALLWVVMILTLLVVVVVAPCLVLMLLSSPLSVLTGVLFLWRGVSIMVVSAVDFRVLIFFAYWGIRFCNRFWKWP